MIFPKYPSLEKKLYDFFYNFVLKTESNYLGLPIASCKLFEGNEAYVVRENNETEKTEFNTLKGSISLTKEEFQNANVNYLLEKYDSLAYDLARQRLMKTFDILSEVTKKTGNIVKGSKTKSDFDNFHELIEKIWIDFDKSNKPIFPMIVAGPDSASKFEKLFKELEENSIYREKFDSLIEKKRVEYNARESNRKLVG